MIQIDVLGLGMLLFICACLALFRHLLPAGNAAMAKGPAFQKLERSLQMALEGGTRLHFSLGRAGLLHNEGAASLSALTAMQTGIAAGTSGDSLPCVTCADGAMTLLSQGTLAAHFGQRKEGLKTEHGPYPLAGVDPASYAAGALADVLDPGTSGNIFLGHSGAEIGLLAEAAERRGTLTLAGTDDLAGQAVLSIWTGEVLYGDASYNAPGLLQAAVHPQATADGRSSADLSALSQASLRTQDLLRWALILAVLGGNLIRSFIR